ncbi:hypothetical protein [Streptomyces sp. Je 1-332]|uniref:hypothetical protein n=1 Tax=Streptomyces sp. Je 1-332 TaxID=3231270 RepID=UPI003457DF5F
MVAGMLAGAVATAVLAAGGGAVGGGAVDGGAPYYEMRVAGRFAPPKASMYSWAVTYDTKLVPPGRRSRSNSEASRATWRSRSG